MNVIAQIRRFNAGREPERLQLKYRAMRKSAFAFLRGSCHLFYARLPRGGVFESAPPVWICGDLHLENFGSYSADNHLAYFDVNDFDESVLAPASWDLVRFLTSVIIGLDGMGAGAKASQRLCAVFVEAYAAALASGKANWVERDTSEGLIRDLLGHVRDRQRASFLDSRTVSKGRLRSLRVDNGKALPALDAERAMVNEFMHGFAKAQADPKFFEPIDVARRVAGTGSLGVERYVVLVRGEGTPDGNHLLDLKLALPSALAGLAKLVQPRWKSQAERIVGIQRRAQAMPMALLQAVTMADRAFVLRALQPSEDKVDLQRATADELEAVIGSMGRIVAWAHLRGTGRNGSAIADDLIAFAGRKKWKAELLAAAQAAAAQVRADAAVFDAAFDAGQFDTAPAAAAAPAPGKTKAEPEIKRKRGIKRKR
ncbi:DUF2252 domain-containing protein [soil metagenome]